MVGFLAMAGVALIFGVCWVVNSPTRLVVTPERFDCDSESPDGVYRCTQDMGHSGWCRNGTVEWRFEAWAIGGDDNTHFAASPVVPESPTVAAATKRHKRIPRPVFWLGLYAVAWVFSYSHDTKELQQEATLGCAVNRTHVSATLAPCTPDGKPSDDRGNPNRPPPKPWYQT